MGTVQQDLTQGSVTRRLVRYALPMVATNLLQSLYGMVDTVVAGHFIGSVGLSAINNAGLVMNFITQIAIGLTVGGNILIGQYFGSRDEAGRKHAAGTLFTLCMLLSLLVGAAVLAVAPSLMRLLGSPALNEAVDYLQTCAFGMPFIFGYNALTANLRGIGNSRKPMECILVSTCVNIVLDVLFVARFHMGVTGTALATVLSQGISFALMLALVLRRREETGFQRPYLRLQWDKIRRIVRYGLPVSLQMTVASISWMVVMVLINKYGVDVSAGNGISNKVKELCQLFITAMTSAAATMAAQNLGAGQPERARQVMRTCLGISLCMAAATIVLCETLAPQLLSIFSNQEAVIAQGAINLRIEILAQVFYAGFMSFNILATAAGHTFFVMWNSFVNCIVVRLVLALVLEHFWGITGVYIACAVAPASSVPIGYVYYRLGKWRAAPRLG